MWLERLAGHASTTDAYPFPFIGRELDFRPLLDGMIRDKLRGREESEIARAFQRAIAEGLRGAVATLCRAQRVDIVVLSGGVFQNEMLLRDLKCLLEPERLEIWTNQVVPSNDGGISLGQAALAALGHFRSGSSFEETDSAWMAHVT